MLGTIMACSALFGMMLYMIIDTKIQDRKREKEEQDDE
jgi:hypothetical protein